MVKFPFEISKDNLLHNPLKRRLTVQKNFKNMNKRDISISMQNLEKKNKSKQTKKRISRQNGVYKVGFVVLNW